MPTEPVQAKKRFRVSATHKDPARVTVEGPGPTTSVELDIDPIADVLGDGRSSVTQSVSARVSDSVRYGPGEWDKIPYAVETFSSVTLPCGANLNDITRAQSLAEQLAWQAARKGLESALQKHVQGIQELYTSYFSAGD